MLETDSVTNPPTPSGERSGYGVKNVLNLASELVYILLIMALVTSCIIYLNLEDGPWNAFALLEFIPLTMLLAIFGVVNATQYLKTQSATFKNGQYFAALGFYILPSIVSAAFTALIWLLSIS